MSRLRARTWTALERRVMRYWRNRNLLGLIILEMRTRRKWGHDLALDAAERIMRTKGYAAGRLTPRHYSRGKWRHATDRGNRALESYHANRKYPFRPQRRYIHMVNIGTPNGPAWYRGGIWVSSGSNPNILVRREE